MTDKLDLATELATELQTLLQEVELEASVPVKRIVSDAKMMLDGVAGRLLRVQQRKLTEVA